MITIKSGVPGSGKTQSMVAELMAMCEDMQKTGVYRPIYTNITGLDPAVIPHKKMHDMPGPGVAFVRDPGLQYTIDWMDCPPESIVVIDEAQDNGYEGLSTQKAVPLHVANFATHRKNFGLDIWLITQHPKLLHVAARRQCGKHQHYERKFGFQSSFCTEWHACEDTLGSRKNATLSRFAFSKKYYKAYQSGPAHTKQKFKFPLFFYLPLLIVPLAAYALPTAYTALSGAMTGKGISGVSGAPATPASAPKSITVKDGMVTTVETTTQTAAAPPASAPAEPAPLLIAGCVATPKKCACMDDKGITVPTEPDFCAAQILGHSTPGQKADLSRIPEPIDPSRAAADSEVFAFMERNRRASLLPNNAFGSPE